MRQLVFLLGFSLISSLLFGKTQVSYDNWFSYWMERISTDIEDINQPMKIAAEKSGAMEEKEGEKVVILKKENAFYFFERIFCGGPPENIEKFIDTEKIPEWSIKKVIDRRKPFINSYGLNLQNPSARNDSSAYLRGLNERYGYLEFVQIIVIEQLTVNKDLRFEDEVKKLFYFLYEGVPPSEIKTNNFTSKGFRNGYAGCHFAPAVIVEKILDYLKICQKSR